MATMATYNEYKHFRDEAAKVWAEILHGDDLMRFPIQILKVDTMWTGAQAIIESVFKNARTAVKAGHSTSKDWSAGIAVLMWLLKYYPSKVILTAPTGRQVEHVMFGEIEKQFDALVRNSPFPISRDSLKKTMLELGPDWYALGFTTSERGEAMGKFAGYKSANMLVVVSEAQDVHDNVYDQIEGIMSSGNAHILEIGNPISPEGAFYDHCSNRRKGYNVITLNCLETPNYKAKKTIIPGMADYNWIEGRREDWGEEHPYWYSRILGEFPQSSTDCIIPINWIMRAIERHVTGHPNYDQAFVDRNDKLKVGGLDVSKGGPDETVHLVLTGRVVSKIDGFHGPDINETVGWAKNLYLEEGMAAYGVDEGGLAGVAGFLEEDNMVAFRFHFNGALEDDEEFDSLGAYAWWSLRTAFQNNEISIPDDPILIAQLSKRKYEFSSRGKRKIKLEAKRDAKARRREESPDRGDALAIAWHTRLMVVSGALEGAGTETSNDASRVQNEIESVSRLGNLKRDNSNDYATSEAENIRY